MVVIDEFPFLIDNFEAVADRFRTWMDHRMQECNVMLIICGSSMSTMLDTLNDTASPLYGRFETQLRVDPLPYREARLLNPGLDEADRMRIYAIAGGVPGYHRKFGSSTPEKGIERLFLGEMPWGTTESDSSMIMDFKGGLYGRVLGAIQGGAEAAVIAQRASTSVQMCSKALDKLVLLGFVRKDISHGRRKGAVYRILDGITAFRFEVIEPNDSRIRGKSAEDAYASIMASVETWYGRRFENICREYVLSTETGVEMGTWWGKVPVMKDGLMVKDANGKVQTEDCDIDIVAEVDRRGSRWLYLAECRFTNWLMSVKDLRDLMFRAERMGDTNPNRVYVLFSISGFTDSLIEYVNGIVDADVGLVSLEAMTEWAESYGNKGEERREDALPSSLEISSSWPWGCCTRRGPLCTACRCPPWRSARGERA